MLENIQLTLNAAMDDSLPEHSSQPEQLALIHSQLTQGSGVTHRPLHTPSQPHPKPPDKGTATAATDPGPGIGGAVCG